MKKMLTITCSFIIASAFSSATLAATNLDNTKRKIPPPTKQQTLKPKEARVPDSNYTNKNKQQTEEKKKNNNQNYGQKVEKKDDPPKK